MYDDSSVVRWIPPLLWGYTLFLLILIAGRSISGWSPEPAGGLTLFGTALALSLWGAWLHRHSSKEWTAEKELLNSGVTVLPVTLIGFFTLAPNSTFSVFATVLGIVLAGVWQIYQAGNMEVAAESDAVSSRTTVADDTLIAPPQPAVPTPEHEPVPLTQPETISETTTAPREQKTFDISLLGESHQEGLSDMDTRVIEIPEEIRRLSDPEPASAKTFDTNGLKPEAPPESCCWETDRSYDLFAEQTEWVVQQFRRTRRPSGCEAIEGFMKVEWQAGQRRQVVHIPFYPPFADRPEIYCEPADETDVRLKVADVRRYGARIELALPHVAESGESTCLHLLACLEGKTDDEIEDSSELNETQLVSQIELNGKAQRNGQGSIQGFRTDA
ncbi:MAG: hypothetical protein CMJ46_06565 [Planctomyces sp.]|nr:hypothetical protein [Planctomyces sp.]